MTKETDLPTVSRPDQETNGVATRTENEANCDLSEIEIFEISIDGMCGVY
ncbi:MAG: mycofactocin precursor [Acidimicrobiaceae bacterium]|nr:mycofactocin precursor [Acidimicrobiaceae bacterium]